MTTFATNVRKLLRGSLLAQAMGFAVLPVLSRLYAPSDFGVVQTALSMLTFLLIVSSLRLEVAVLTVPEPELANLLGCAAWLSLSTSLLIWLLGASMVVTGNSWVAEHAVLVLLLPGIGLLAGWNQLMNYLALRRYAFDVSSNAKVVQALGYASSGVGLGFANPAPVSLLVADALGRLMCAGFVVRRLGVALSSILRPPSREQLKSVMTRHRSLVTTGLGAALINTAGSAFTTLMLLWLFSAAAAGQYAIVERLVGIPIAMIVGASSQVLMSHLGRAIGAGQTGEAVKTFRRIILQHALLAALPSLVLFFFAPTLMPFVLGGEWQLSGRFLQALIPLYFLSFIVGPVNMTLTVVGKYGLQLRYDIFRLIGMAAMWFYIWYSGIAALVALWLYAAVSGLCLLAYLLISDSALRGLGAESSLPA